MISELVSATRISLARCVQIDSLGVDRYGEANLMPRSRLRGSLE
jgi:hypothetical protein